MAIGLLFTAAGSVAAAVLFAMAGTRFLRRDFSAGTRAAGIAFGAWWLLLAAILADDALRVLLGLSGAPSVTAYLLLVYLKMALMVAAVVALGSYVGFLWTGRLWPAVPIAAAALGHGLFFANGLAVRLPAEVDVAFYSTRIVLQPLDGTVPAPLGAFVFFAPGLLLALAYGLLMLRVDRPSRRRAVAVLASLVVVFLVGSIQFNPLTPGDSPIFVVLVGLTVLGGILACRGVPSPASGGPQPPEGGAGWKMRDDPTAPRRAN